MRVLVTGGAGYIGSHTCLALLEAGHEVVVVDNLSNGHAEALARVGDLTGRTIPLVVADLRDKPSLDQAFARHTPQAVIHFAALKAVGDSVREPLAYYDNNLVSTLRLLQVMDAHGVRDLVYSSSAAVYGAPEAVPLREGARTEPTNPYGRTKCMCERILADLVAADGRFNVTLLRYFNPIGAHPSGRIGEDPRGVPTNLLPYIAQVAVGLRPHLVIHGDDYDTPDGTGVRDYVHVMDLAQGHVAALDRLHDPGGLRCVNLGTGRGYSVREVVTAFERASGRPIPTVVGPRRPGDVAAVWADPRRARSELGWRATRDLTAMCTDHWRWQRDNPQGYDKTIR